MAKTVKFGIDTEKSHLWIDEGRLFLGTAAKIDLLDWAVDDDGYVPVVTVFLPGSPVPLAQSSYGNGALTLNLTGEGLRKAFRCSPTRHQFTAYLNQKMPGGTWKPDVEAVGSIWIDWSPEAFDAEAGTVATMEGPPGQDGQDGKSAYQLAVENGYTGTVREWLASMEVANALKGKTFEFSTATAIKIADGLKMVFQALGGTVL